MTTPRTQSLRELLDLFDTVPAIRDTRRRLESGAHAGGEVDPDGMRRLYQHALALVEEVLWGRGADEAALALYQASFRELEQLIAQRGRDRRHRFVVIIPVADRPHHLATILESLLELCRAFHYGGLHEGRFQKVVAVIADDSLDEDNILRNTAIARDFGAQGIETVYFGAEAQAAQLQALSPELRAGLERILGHPEETGFRHKGASVNRNIAYLLAREMADADAKHLFYFVDSDQQFKVRAGGKPVPRDLAGVNYLYYLDRIFTERQVQVLTGKVVGDPPVSPAVMAGTFLADVISFLEQIAAAGVHEPCQFHIEQQRKGGDASYHDMAELFGFTPATESFRYHCPLSGAHDHATSLNDFSSRLDRFFHGEHPTRVTLYAHQGGFLGLGAARTVYTGNYVCTAQGLSHFIPFAPLRLRMAGPVLGRLIRAELGDGFVSANLPLLHTRASPAEGQFEFRPGVRREETGVDLSGEFERQFFGDVMLFTMERLIERGYPDRAPAPGEARTVLDAVEEELRCKYMQKRSEISERLHQARSLFNDRRRWWGQGEEHEGARANFRRFFANIERNFGHASRGYRLIGPGENRDRRRREILDAIAHYADDKAAWEATLDAMGQGRTKGRGGASER